MFVKSFTIWSLDSKRLRADALPMNKAELSEYFSKMGRRGGKARLKKMTKAERQAIARMGGSASKGKPKKVKRGGAVNGS